MKAHPTPMVSGSHFLPAAPLLCTKLMPACLVISRNVTCAAPAVARVTHIKISKNDFRMSFMGSGLFACCVDYVFFRHRRSLLHRSKRNRNMLVNQLPFV